MNNFDFIELYKGYKEYCHLNNQDRNVYSFQSYMNKYNHIDYNITKIMNTEKDILDIYDIMIIEYKKFIKNIIDISFIFVNCNFEKQKEFKEKMYKSLDDIK